MKKALLLLLAFAVASFGFARQSVQNGCFVESVEFVENYRRANPGSKVDVFDVAASEVGIAAIGGHTLAVFTRDGKVYGRDYLLGEFLISSKPEILTQPDRLSNAVVREFRTVLRERRDSAIVVESEGRDAVVNAFQRLETIAQAQCIRVTDKGSIREGVVFLFKGYVCLYFPDAGTKRAKLSKPLAQHIAEMSELSPDGKVVAFKPRS